MSDVQRRRQAVAAARIHRWLAAPAHDSGSRACRDATPSPPSANASPACSKSIVRCRLRSSRRCCAHRGDTLLRLRANRAAFAYFAEHLERRGTPVPVLRPYDQMAVAFPAISRLVAPRLLVGRAANTGDLRVHALEPVILVRKPRDANPRAHLHIGKAGCGGTLNSLALVAHCRKGGYLRCIVVGTRPLTRHQDLELSVPLALRALCSQDLNHAALLLSAALARTQRCWRSRPLVSNLLSGGGPHGRGDHNADQHRIGRRANEGQSSQLIHERQGSRRGAAAVAAADRRAARTGRAAGKRGTATRRAERAPGRWCRAGRADPHKLAAEIAELRSRRERQKQGPAGPNGISDAASGCRLVSRPGVADRE